MLVYLKHLNDWKSKVLYNYVTQSVLNEKFTPNTVVNLVEHHSNRKIPAG